MATHSSIPAWRIPWTEEPGRLQSTGSQKVGQDWVTKHSTAQLVSGIWKSASAVTQMDLILCPFKNLKQSHRHKKNSFKVGKQILFLYSTLTCLFLPCFLYLLYISPESSKLVIYWIFFFFLELGKKDAFHSRKDNVILAYLGVDIMND